MTEPSQHFWNSTGLELSVLFMMLKSLTLTLPTLTRVPVPTELPLLAPHENDMMSISPTWFCFCDSPSTPSSFRYASYAMGMILSFAREFCRWFGEERPPRFTSPLLPFSRLSVAFHCRHPG